MSKRRNYAVRRSQVSSDRAKKYTVSVDDGLMLPAMQRESPNQDARPEGVEPSLIVLHGISLPPGEYGGPYIEQLFANELDGDAHPFFATLCEMRVSAHLLVNRDGSLLQFVPFNRRAWHAGESGFRGASACNDFSIGIELEGDDETTYEQEQYDTLTGVVRALLCAYQGLSVRQIAGHCDVAPGRKTDPGPVFDWLRLYDGLAEIN